MKTLKPMKWFTYKAWIHPLAGGDDYAVEVSIAGATLKGATEALEKWLARRSYLTTAYRLLRTTPYKEAV